MIYVAGDSHCNIFKRDDDRTITEPGFTIWYDKLNTHPKLGPTAHGLTNIDSRSRFRYLFLKAARQKRRIKLLLSFGEIDCRLHIYNNHRKKNIPIDTLIDKTIDNYMQFIEEMRERRYRIVVLGIPPCGRQKNNFFLPYYPDSHEQSEIYRSFNEKLKGRYEKYIDVYSFAADQDGFIEKRFEYDNSHLNNKETFPFVLSELKKIGFFLA